MNDRQSSDALNDDPLAREIERALTVDPSPEFVVNVRARVSAGPKPAGPLWRFRWALGTAGLAITVTAAAVAMLDGDTPYLGGTRGDGLPPRQVVAAMEPEPIANGSSPSPGVGQPDAPGASRRRFDSRDTGALSRTRPALVRGPVRNVWSLPRVIVSPAEADALRALLADAHAGRFALTPAPDLDLVRADASSESPEIVITPLEIEPLVRSLSREELEGEEE